MREGKGRVCRVGFLTLAVTHVKLHRQTTYGIGNGLHGQSHGRHLNRRLGRHRNIRMGWLGTEEPSGQRVGERYRFGRSRLRVGFAKKARKEVVERQTPCSCGVMLPHCARAGTKCESPIRANRLLYRSHSLGLLLFPPSKRLSRALLLRQFELARPSPEVKPRPSRAIYLLERN